MVATVGITLGLVFAVVVIGFVYGLLFVSQPLEQAPNDKEFISLMATIVTFLSGTLAGIVASNGMKDKRCDRVGTAMPKPHAHEAWRKYDIKTVTGAPGGDWLHIEITRTLAENESLVRQAFAKAFPTI
jgi:hypothetical protein